MTTSYEETRERLRSEPAVWLVTGAAGFIGSHLAEQLLELDQTVIGLDNFATGHRSNLDSLTAAVTPVQRERFRFVEGGIEDLDVCRRACDGADYVLHQAALGSVPRSVDDPIASNVANVVGFLNMLVAARDGSPRRFVYAASSAAYGDAPELPKVEDETGQPLSPYAVTKVTNELYAKVFQALYDIDCVGLRYFNVFGPRQDPNGAYAAVIPKWIGALLQGEVCEVYGTGEASRDFCYIDNAVQANLLAATTTKPDAVGQVYNIACGQQTTLNELFRFIRDKVTALEPNLEIRGEQHTEPRPGDIEHSLADISKARQLLGYEPSHDVVRGLDITIEWFVSQVTQRVDSVSL